MAQVSERLAPSECVVRFGFVPVCGRIAGSHAPLRATRKLDEAHKGDPIPNIEETLSISQTGLARIAIIARVLVRPFTWCSAHKPLCAMPSW